MNATECVKRLALPALMRTAAANPGTTLGEAAIARAVEELLEVEIDHRLTRAHDNAGYASASPLAFAGEGGGDTARGQSCRVERAAERHQGGNAWRGVALELLGILRDRPRRAVLVGAFLITPTAAARRSLRMMTAAEACDPERLADIYQHLGWPPRSGPEFASETALNNSAYNARKRLREALAGKLSALVADGCDPGKPAHG